MDVTLDTRNVTVPATFRNRLTHRVSGFFSRFDHSVRKLHVTLKDVNGPRGGIDKVCQLNIELTDGKQIIVQECSNRLVKSIGLSIRRARNLVARQLKKKRPRRISMKRMVAAPA
jgi:putative sigma-54 modulation protein